MAAEPLARFYDVPGLALYLRIVALSYLIGPFVAPIFALMQREMAFDKIALITIIATLINAVATILFASLGYSYLSFALANVISASCGMLLGFYFRPQFSAFRICLSEWPALLNFGSFRMGMGMLTCLRLYMPYLIIGRVLDNTAIGLYQRAITVSTLPNKAVSAIDYVAFPAISAHLREGGNIKQAFLRAALFVTGVTWPGFLTIALLAYPLVSILLGPNWLEVSPLVFIMALGRLFNFAASLTNSSLLAAGRARQLFLMHLILVPFTMVVTLLSAPYGINTVAWALCITAPLECAVALYSVRLVVSFSVAELLSALRPSAIVTLTSAIGPLFVMETHGWNPSLPIGATSVALILAAFGWAVGLRLTGHPLWDEIRHAAAAGAKRLPGRRNSATAN